MSVQPTREQLEAALAILVHISVDADKNNRVIAKVTGHAMRNFEKHVHATFEYHEDHDMMVVTVQSRKNVS